MKSGKNKECRARESGIALLLAIFVLLLVCVIGIAMIAASGTETSLSSNYRSSTSAYYAALAGLEEGRSRLLPKNPGYLPTAATLPLGRVIYIVNHLPGETVDPTDWGNPASFADSDYANEYPGYVPPLWTKFDSVQVVAGSGNPLYKWVRIAPLTEKALQIDVNNTNPSDDPPTYRPDRLVYFDGTNLTRTVTPNQALGVTALAALPDGSQKTLQYIVGPVTLQLPIVAALTMESSGTPANTVTFTQPPTPTYSFHVNGRDQAPGNLGGVTCPVQPMLPAIGVLNSADYVSVHDSTLMTPQPGNYTGSGGTTPNVSNPYVNPNNGAYDMANMNSLLNLVQTVQDSADVVITPGPGGATAADMPPAMTAANPMTVFVDGNLALTGFTGYGLLLVTGKLTYTGDSGWKGIVLMIGQGSVEEIGSDDGGEFDGAVFLANTLGGGGPVLGPVSYIVASPGGRGIYYNSCWIAKSLKPTKYKVLAFHEIPHQ